MTTRAITFSAHSLTPVPTVNISFPQTLSMATTDDNLRMVIASVQYLYFSLYNTTTNKWSDPSQFSFGDDFIYPNGYYNISITADGSRVFTTNYLNKVSFYTWNGYTYTNKLNIPGTDRQWRDISCTPDGNTLVATENNGGVYFTKWNSETGNYNAWTNTQATSIVNLSNNIVITADGNKLFYQGDYRTGGSIYYLLWNESIQNFGPPVQMNVIVPLTGDSRYSVGISLTRDGRVLIIGTNSQSGYVVIDPITHEYGPFVAIPLTSMNSFGPKNTWISYDNKVMYWSSNNGIRQTTINYTVDGSTPQITYSTPVPFLPPVPFSSSMNTRSVSLSTATVSPINMSNVYNRSWISVATTSDNKRMIMCSLQQIYLSLYNSTTNVWSEPTQLIIGNNSGSSWGYTCVCVTADGSRVIATSYGNDVSVFFWNGYTYTGVIRIPDSEPRTWGGITCTPNGSTLVGAVQYGGVYFTKWNSSTGNYNAWTRTSARITNNSICAAITEDGSKFFYGGGRVDDGGFIYYLLWNSSTNNFGPPVRMDIAKSDPHITGISVTRDGAVLFLANPVQSGYVIIDPITHQYGPYTLIATTAIRVNSAAYSSWLSYDNKFLYYSSSNLLYQTAVTYRVNGNQLAMTYPLPPDRLPDPTASMNSRAISFGNSNISLDTSSIPNNQWVSVATTNDNLRMVICTRTRLYLSTFNIATNSWTNPSLGAFGAASTGSYGYTEVCMSANGITLMVANSVGYVSVYTWTGFLYASPITIQDTQTRDWQGIDCSADGSVLVGIVPSGAIYFSKYNSNTRVYSRWAATSATSVGNSKSITITGDGLKIMYGGGDGSGSPISYMVWNTNNFGTPVQLSSLITPNQNFSGLSITRDGAVLVIANPTQSGYVVIDPDTHQYGPYKLISLNAIHANTPRYTWMSYDNTVIYYSALNHVYQSSVHYTVNGSTVPMPYPLPPPPAPLYLGNDISIIYSNILFNNANVFVKAPTLPAHVVNKAYVDSANTGPLGDMVANAASARSAQSLVLAGMITDLRAIKSDLETELNNLYQYFFDENRDGPAPTR